MRVRQGPPGRHKGEVHDFDEIGTVTGGVAALGRQRRPQHRCTPQQRAVLRLPPGRPHPPGRCAEAGRRFRLQPQHGARQEPVGRGQGRGHPGHRVPQSQPVPLPLDGHLAHGPARRHRRLRLAGAGHPRDGPGRRQRADGRELRPRAPAGAVVQGRPGRLGRQTWRRTGCCRTSRTSTPGSWPWRRSRRYTAPARARTPWASS